MATSRRNFLKTGGMGLAFLGVPAAVAKAADRSFAAGLSSGSGNQPFSFTKESFARHVNTVFNFRTDRTTVNAKLTKITDHKVISKRPELIAGKESFSLIFVTSNIAPTLTQNTYPVEHDVLGQFSLFVVPVGLKRNRHYEAIVSRL